MSRRYRRKEDSDGVKSEREIRSSEKSPIDQISTILTKGHHRKFQELLAIFGKNANNAVEDLSYKNRMARKKEFGILCELFLEERNAYSLALEQFRLDNSKRFAIGFNGKIILTLLASLEINLNVFYS